MRVALAFFGLPRSLRHTIASIACQVEAPLAEAGVEVRRVGHFHRPDRIDNPRSGEHDVEPADGDTVLLGLDAVTVEPQDPALIQAEWAACRRGADPFGDGYRSLQNLCFQLRSLRAVFVLAEEWSAPDGYVLFLRPDLLYLDRLDVPVLVRGMMQAGHDLLVPGWQSWGGLNDRFALCRSGRAARAYAGRAALLAEMVDDCGAVHPEALLARATEAAGLHVGTLDARAVRIRANGRAAHQDLLWFGTAA